MAAQISPLPSVPSRQDPTNFNDRADAFLGALPTFQSEANALSTEVNTRADNVQASDLAVLAATNITKWVSGTTYAQGAVVWSPINGLGYRRTTANGSGTTDPSLDTTNYKQVNGTGDVSTTGDQNIAGVKTFSTPIAVGSGGTGASTAAAAFNNIKQAATESYAGVVELATSQEAYEGTAQLVAITPATLRNAMNATSPPPMFAARAWVNFNGTGTVAIRSSGNVSSITDNGVGDYIVNFTTAMPDTNYCTVGSCRRGLPSGDTNADFSFPLSGTYSTSAVQVRTQSYNDRSNIDADIVNITIFR
jgi:hypothetical protein